MNLLRQLQYLSLRTKMVLPISVVAIVIMLSISAFLIKQLTDAFRREMETTGETMVRMLAVNVESGVLFESQYDLAEAIRVLKRFKFVQHVIVTNIDGKVLIEDGRWPYAEDEISVIPRKKQHPAHQDCQHHFIESEKDGRQFLRLVVPVVSRIQWLNRETLGITGAGDASGADADIETIGHVRMTLSLDAVNADIAETQRTIVILTALVLLFALVMLNNFVKFFTQPIKKLVEATSLISRGDFTRKVDIEQEDEIGQLAATFNKMIDSLRQSRDEIEKYNHALEEKILERTIELGEAQAQLVQSEKLSAIGQLAAGVAHELNNPLGGILGYAQFAIEKLRKANTEGASTVATEDYVRYLTDIETQARRCKAIVQNLLRFSRSSHIAEFESVDINQVIEDTRAFIEHQLRMKDMELTVRTQNNLPAILGDAGQLQQVFTNLIINAMQASSSGSEIQLISRVSPALGEFSGAVEVLCVDRGTGIAKEDLRKIFEPFFTTKGVGQGTGLGLSVSYGIVRDHGGEIKVTSTVGKGTTFTVILPVQKPASASDIGNKDALKPTTQV